MASDRGAFEKEIRYGGAGGYTSEFSEVDESERKRTWRDDQLSGIDRRPNRTFGMPSKQIISQEYDREEAKNHRFHLLSLDAYSRHKLYINNYLKYYGGSMEDFKRDSSRDKTDYDVIHEQHRFVWSDEDDADSSWEKRLAKKYYDKLFKEYCISDLSRYKENKVALRWRIEKEVVSGKGQFICGNKICNVTADLQSWEVNFSYREHGEKKNTLVKLRLCPDCSLKLNYHHKKKAVKRKSRKETKHKKSKRKRKSDEESEDCDLRKSSKREESNERQADQTTTSKESLSATDVWEKPVTTVIEKTREEEFDDYFDEMFL